MTLEQIKNRQEQINEMLYTLLNDTVVVVERIIGEQPKEDSALSGKDYAFSGLLDEINKSQNFTENYLQKLSEYSRLLCNRTFAPVEVECAKVKWY